MAQDDDRKAALDARERVRPSDDDLQAWASKEVSRLRLAAGLCPGRVDRGACDEADLRQVALLAAYAARDEYDPAKASRPSWRTHVIRRIRYALGHELRSGRSYGIRLVQDGDRTTPWRGAGVNRSREQRAHDQVAKAELLRKTRTPDADAKAADDLAARQLDTRRRDMVRARVWWTLGTLSPTHRAALVRLMERPEATRAWLAREAGLAARTLDRRLTDAKAAFAERWGETKAEDVPARAFDLVQDLDDDEI